MKYFYVKEDNFFPRGKVRWKWKCERSIQKSTIFHFVIPSSPPLFTNLNGSALL